MLVLETKFFERNGNKYRIQIAHDSDAENPLDDCDGMGKIYSLNRRHINFKDPDEIREIAESSPHCVPLGYYEHGQCLWFVAGHAPPGADCRFDGVPFAGIWVPDEDTVQEVEALAKEQQRPWLEERVKHICETYSQWCNGEVYCYAVERMEKCDHGHEHGETIGACCGFFGMDECWTAAMEELGEENLVEADS